jgi:hypothetical protein
MINFCFLVNLVGETHPFLQLSRQQLKFFLNDHVFALVDGWFIFRMRFINEGGRFRNRIGEMILNTASSLPPVSFSSNGSSYDHT